MVRVTWAAPAGPPAGGYRIVDTDNNIDESAQSSPQMINVPQLGVYNFQVMYTSQHFPGGEVGPRQITVRGMEV